MILVVTAVAIVNIFFVGFALHVYGQGQRVTDDDPIELNVAPVDEDLDEDPDDLERVPAPWILGGP